MKVYKHSSRGYVTVCEIPLSEIERVSFALCQQPRETVDPFYRREKPDVVTNGGFFSMADGTTAFTMKSGGRMVSQQGYPMGIGITEDGRFVQGDVNKISCRDFLSAYPMLVVDGRAMTSFDIAHEIDYPARRTALGYNGTTLYLVTVDNPGLGLVDLASLMRGLGCTTGANFDGGGSTRMLVSGKAKTAMQLYNRPVDNVVAVWLKKAIFYRVQTGAFAVRGNAERYLAEIQALGGVYGKAYINKDGMYYKVQVGYFGVKSNAEAMVADLRSRGIEAYITKE